MKYVVINHPGKRVTFSADVVRDDDIISQDEDGKIVVVSADRNRVLIVNKVTVTLPVFEDGKYLGPIAKEFRFDDVRLDGDRILSDAQAAALRELVRVFEFALAQEHELAVVE